MVAGLVKRGFGLCNRLFWARTIFSPRRHQMTSALWYCPKTKDFSWTKMNSAMLPSSNLEMLLIILISSKLHPSSDEVRIWYYGNIMVQRMGLNVHVDILVYAVTQTTHKHFNCLLFGHPSLHRVECTSSCISILMVVITIQTTHQLWSTSFILISRASPCPFIEVSRDAIWQANVRCYHP